MSREGGWSRTRSSCTLGSTGASGSGPAALNRLTKGRVERPVSSIRKNFFYGRDFGSDEELSARMLRWLGTEANVRVHGTLKERPVDRLDRESLRLSDSLTRQQRKRRQTAAWTPDLPLGTSEGDESEGGSEGPRANSLEALPSLYRPVAEGRSGRRVGRDSAQSPWAGHFSIDVVTRRLTGMQRATYQSTGAG